MQYLAVFIVPKTVAIFLSVFIFPRLHTRRRRHDFLCSQENILFDAVQICPVPPRKYVYVSKKIPKAVAIFINLCFPKITHTRRCKHNVYALKRLFCWMPYKYAPIPLPNMRMFSKYTKRLQYSSIVGFHKTLTHADAGISLCSQETILDAVQICPDPSPKYRLEKSATRPTRKQVR